MAALLLFSPKPSSHNVVESFDHPATVEAHEKVLLKMLAQSPFGSMLRVTGSRDLDDVKYKVPFVDTLHVLRNIFMEQVITEEEKRTSPANNHFSSTNMSPPMTPNVSTPTTPIKSAAPAVPTKTVAVAAATVTATATATTAATAKKSLAPAATATKSSPWLTEENADAEVTFTPDEESWINKQLVKFTSTYREVGHYFVPKS